RHPKVFERSCVRRAALLDVDFTDPKMIGKPLGLDEGRISFAERDDVFLLELGQDQLFLGPYAAHAAKSGIQKMLPVRGGPALQSIHVVTNFQKAAARLASINNLVQPVSDSTSRKAFKPRVKTHGKPKVTIVAGLF